MKDTSQDKIFGKILIHVPFYFVEERFKYLEQLLNNFRTYNFTEIRIVIDTNSEIAEKLIYDLTAFDKGKMECVVHKNLSHPFLLTWQHRKEMKEKINDYDFFMYVEDDILVPWKAVESWYKDTQNIYSQSYIRGFLRVEKNADGVLMSTDITERFSPKSIELRNRRYFAPPNPYHAFWMYTKNQMMEFIHLKAWEDGNHDSWGIRERAAAGMMWDDKGKCRILIPLGEKNDVLEETLVYHLPNNYALDKKSQFGKIPVYGIFCSYISFKMKKVRNFIDVKIIRIKN